MRDEDCSVASRSLPSSNVHWSFYRQGLDIADMINTIRAGGGSWENNCTRLIGKLFHLCFDENAVVALAPLLTLEGYTVGGTETSLRKIYRSLMRAEQRRGGHPPNMARKARKTLQVRTRMRHRPTQEVSPPLLTCSPKHERSGCHRISSTTACWYSVVRAVPAKPRWRPRSSRGAVAAASVKVIRPTRVHPPAWISHRGAGQ